MQIVKLSYHLGKRAKFAPITLLTTVRYIILTIVGLVIISKGFAQETPPLKIGFTRQNNFTYSTQWGINWKKEKGKYKISIFSNHDNLYNSLLKPPFVQVTLFHRIWQYYQFSKQLSAASWIESDQFFHNKNQRYNIYGGIEYRLKKDIVFTPLLGYSWDYLNQRLNHGVSPGLKAEIAHQWEDGLQMQTKLFYREKFIRPRRQRNLSFVSSWEKGFEENATLAVGVSGGSNEMDTYKKNSVEKIISDTLTTNFRVQYHPWRFFYIESDNQLGVTRRRFNYVPFLITAAEFNNLWFEQTDLVTRQKAGFRFARIEGYLSYEYSLNDRRYKLSNNLAVSQRDFEELQNKERLKDFVRNVHQTQFQVMWQIRRQTFRLVGDNRYVQYDTPAAANFDDHDELNYGLTGEWRGAWGSHFSTRYSLEGTRRQYSFLFKEKSADNYTQYVLRTELEHQWNITPKFRWRANHWLYVAYNVKDFEDITLSNRSNRNLEVKWEFQYNPSRRWQLNTTLYRKESHLSFLNWQRFTETTLDTTRTVFWEHKNTLLLFQQEKKGAAWFDFGYKHFYLFRFQNVLMYDTTNILTSINLHIRNFQTGPLTGFRVMGKKNTSYDIMIWWQYQLQDNRYKKIDKFPLSLMSYKETDLIKKNTAFRPFAEVKILFFF